MVVHATKAGHSAALQDRLVLGKLAGESILTMGATSAELDVERAWRRELGACSTKFTGELVQLCLVLPRNCNHS